MLAVKRRGNQLEVNGSGGSSTAGVSTLPTEHWNADVVNDRAVINTITGQVNVVDVTFVGLEQVETENDGPVTARHFVYRGELNNEVWYDEKGRWVKMRFPAKDGSTIEYRCVSCGRGASTSRS